ncbi:PAS domain-containing protein [Spirosoma utsteinense]|uniref:PAS domain-containing protein n=1 Tax=Spirosoma utsteinense TaxID=2585773 RepID=UPI0016452F6F|nr:PAS domain-containing protein [Spirosoma utsteinense]
MVTDRSSQIMWVSHTFSRLTGYESCEMLGKTPVLLQGPLTSTTTRALIRGRLARCEAVTVTLQNYRKDQTPYWCQITIDPLSDQRGECTHFMATEEECPDLSH